MTMTSNQDKARQERAGYGDMKATYPKKTTVVIETLESAATIGDVFFFLLNVLDDVFLKCKNCHKVLINVLFPPASGFNFDVLNPLVVPV